MWYYYLMLGAYEVVCWASFEVAIKLCWNGWKVHFKAKNKAFFAFVPLGAQRQGTEAKKALFFALKCAFQPFQHSLSAAEKLARHTTSYVTNIVYYITFALFPLIPHTSHATYQNALLQCLKGPKPHKLDLIFQIWLCTSYSFDSYLGPYLKR